MPTHSLTSARAAGAIPYPFSRSPGTAWLVSAALTSHVLRDASSGTAPLLWPLPSASIARWLYYGGELGLLCLSHLLFLPGPLDP